MDKFIELKTLVLNLEEDMSKFYNKTNKAAGVRVRKSLQEVKALAQALRVDISAQKKA